MVLLIVRVATSCFPKCAKTIVTGSGDETIMASKIRSFPRFGTSIAMVKSQGFCREVFLHELAPTHQHLESTCSDKVPTWEKHARLQMLLWKKWW